MTGQSSKYLAPEVLSKIAPLELRARHVVEGYLSGLHRSPYHGLSVEFAEHRPYSPGYELKHIDWKLWARSDRFYVKLYQEESNVRAQFLVDASASMAYRSGAMSKYDYGATLAASLAWLLLLQGDAVGLTAFAETARRELAPSARPAHVHSFCALLEQSRPEGGTNLGSLLHEAAARIRKRGMVVLVSDLLAPLNDILLELRRFRYDGHAVVVLHVVDPHETSFPFDGNVQFESMEGAAFLRTQARLIRRAYLESFRQFTDTLRAACQQEQVDYLMVQTDWAPDVALSRLLLGAPGHY